MKKISNNNYKNLQQGQAVITAVIFFLTISVVVLVGIATPISSQIRTASDFLQSKQGYMYADSLNEEALYRLNKGRTLPVTMVLAFSSSSPSATITDVNGMKQVIATGIAGSLSRMTKSIFSQADGVSINYGLQVGNGGLVMSGSAKIKGNAYVNGNIVGSGSVTITGSAVAAVATTQFADQTNSSTTVSINTGFGTTTASQDMGQSFTVSTSTAISQVSLYIKKNGAPANATVKILSNSSGNPSSGSALSSGTLSASAVTTSYGWVNIPLTTAVSLTPGTTYWAVVDVASNSTTNYYTIATTNNNSYTSGQLKRGQVGGSWTIPNASYDGFFQIYLGGASSISGISSIGASGGDARAFTVTNSTVVGSLYCQVGSGNNKSCNTSQAIPSPAAFPFSDANITEWKDTATALGVRNGSLSVGGSTSTTTNGMKIVGDLNVTNSGDLTINGPLYVTGNVTISGSGKLRLGSSFGASSGYIVTDGKIDIGGSGMVYGSGTAGSYVVLVTTSTCGGTTTCSSDAPAVTLSGSAGAVVLLAPYGRIDFDGSAEAKAAVAYKMVMPGSTELEYESGLADISFTSGPSGAWAVNSWQEIPQ